MPDTDDHSRPDLRHPPRPRAVAIVVVILVLGAAAYWLITRGPGARLISPRNTTVARFSGNGDRTTDPFRVREGWRIDWRHSGKRFAFVIRGDRDFGTVIDDKKPGDGVTSPTGSGTFRLEVTANGPWTIRIVQER